MSGYLILLIVLATAILPFVIGNYLARSFKMPDYGWKIGVVLLAFAASALISATGTIQLGPDLRGGVIMVYAIDREAMGDDEPVEMDRLVAAVAKRVNPGGVKEVTVRPYGPDHIEIIIPMADADELERIERKISRAGTLEFRILANRTDHDAEIREALDSPARQLRRGDQIIARWVPVDERSAQMYRDSSNFATRQTPDERTEILVMIDGQNVTGQYLRRVSTGIDQRGADAVDFLFEEKGANLFYRLTSDNVPDPTSGFERNLGIILDGELYSAPQINSPISSRGQITGRFTREEVEDLVGVLQAGSLPAALTEEPISSQVIGPTLGKDTIERGALAMMFAMIAVPIFMVFYYRFAGIVADLMLVLTLLLIVAVMITVKAAFTLPGLAGLVLTVGMSVDANVLIFERIREELSRGAALRMAIRNGFGRALSSIVDANVTTLITAIVLYVIGTDQVKGFAVTLFLGIVMSMFTAIFCSRVIFDVAERRRWITNLRMMSMVGETHFDFMRQRKLAIGVAAVIIVIGLIAVVDRGKGLLNIDFTGGTKVEALFVEPQSVADIRAKVSTELPDVTVNDVQIRGEPAGIRFQVITSDPDKEKVQDKLEELFAGQLATNHMTFELARIEEADSSSAAEPTDETPAEPAAEEGAALRSNLTDAAGLLALAFQEEDAPSEAPAEESSTDEPAEPAPEPTAEVAPAEEPAAEEAPAEEPTAEEEPAGDDAPSETPAPETEMPAEPQTPATPEPANQAADEASPSAQVLNPYANGTEATLQFTEAIDRATLEDRLRVRLEDPDANYADTRFEINHPEGVDVASARSTEWSVKLAVPEDQAQQLFSNLQQELESATLFPSAEEIGGQVANNTRFQAIYAMVGSLLATIIYLWIRFQRVAFGLAAVVATIHDVLITLGVLALSAYVADYTGFLMISAFKIDLPIVAAFLTLIGYTLNDTIITFDRLREIRGKSPHLNADMLNLAVNQTLSRTLLTAGTTMIVVLILYIGGGEGIHGFAFTLLIGVFVGTFSSIYIASPVLLWLSGDAASSNATGKSQGLSGYEPARVRT